MQYNNTTKFHTLNYRIMKTQEIINAMKARISELRDAKETLMGRMQHYRINYTGWMDSEDGKKAQEEYARIEKQVNCYTIAVLTLKQVAEF